MVSHRVYKYLKLNIGTISTKVNISFMLNIQNKYCNINLCIAIGIANIFPCSMQCQTFAIISNEIKDMFEIGLKMTWCSVHMQQPSDDYSVNSSRTEVKL